MDIKELTDLLVTSSEQFNQTRFIPWWQGDHENSTYYYQRIEDKVVQDAMTCISQCGKEILLAPVGHSGLTLFHLLVWHNFHDLVETLLRDGTLSGPDIDVTDHKGHGRTPLLLACAQGNLAMVRLLLEYGADDSRQDDRGMNAYHFLAYPRFEDLAVDFTCLENSVEQRGEIAGLLTCDINLKNAKGLTPLEHLVSTEYSSNYTWPLAEVFLEKGASTDYVDEDGNTLLMLARRNNHRTAALQLMKHCPDLINTANKNCMTPLQNAIEYRNMAMYIALTDHGAKPEPGQSMDLYPLEQITENAFADVNSDNRDSLSLALYLAEKLIRRLDPDDDDELGEMMSILHNALYCDPDAHILDVCQEAGLDFTMPVYYHGEQLCIRDKCLELCHKTGILDKLASLGVDMNRAVLRGRTPANILASGARMSDSREEAFFTEAAAYFSTESMEQMDSNGEAAVHLAAGSGHTGMLQVMIEKGVNINLTKDAPADAGTTALHDACGNGHADMVRLLMDAGADDTLRNLKGETPAHFAVMKKKYGKALDTEQRIALLKELKNVDLAREDGRTPLMLLEDLRTPQSLLTLFLERGADVNHADNSGMTPLMLYPDKESAKELIRAGADVNSVDREGNTALHYALRYGSPEDARYLIKKGADYNRPNQEGETPVQIAVENGMDAVLELMTDIQ